jgi:hypothetical protein
MVAALIMGAAIRPRPVGVKMYHAPIGASGNDNDYQIVGFHGAGITR